MRKMRNTYRILVKKSVENIHLGDMGIGERIILKCTLNKEGVGKCAGFMWPQIRVYFWALKHVKNLWAP
jgi:hypothetical protein